MSTDANERLEALRREVLAETPPPPTPEAPPVAAASAVPAAPSRPEVPVAAAVPRSIPSVPPPSHPAPAIAGADADAPSHDHGGWDIGDLLGDASLSTWIGVGLLVVGGYLVLSWFVPGIELVGSIIILGAGVVLLAQHFLRGARPLALYLGALLTGIGGARLIGDLLPGSPSGLTAIGVGLAFLAIGYLRHSQAGGYGWQGVVGVVALGIGLIQFVLGLLPGSPGLLDLVFPGILIGAGVLLLMRARGSPDRAAR